MRKFSRSIITPDAPVKAYFSSVEKGEAIVWLTTKHPLVVASDSCVGTAEQMTKPLSKKPPTAEPTLKSKESAQGVHDSDGLLKSIISVDVT